MIVHVPWLWADGFTVLPNLMFIKTSHKDDQVLIAHERVHQNQMRRDGVLTFWFRYLIPEWRLNYEVEAYKESYRLRPESLYFYAKTLAENYKLNITVDQAIELISG